MRPSLFIIATWLTLAPLSFAAAPVATARALAEGKIRHVHTVIDDEEHAVLDTIFFHQRDFEFRVVDNPGNVRRLDDAMTRSGALAGVNGGFFHPDDTPLGLVISSRKTLHPLEYAKLLSGLVVVTDKTISLLRTAEYSPRIPAREALQAGPFLVDHGTAVAGLDDRRRAARTVIISDGQGRFGLVLCREATLAGMARLLTRADLWTDFTIARALNLDGGSSSALWFRTEPPFYSREWKAVRNFLGVFPRVKSAKKN